MIVQIALRILAWPHVVDVDYIIISIYFKLKIFEFMANGHRRLDLYFIKQSTPQTDPTINIIHEQSILRPDYMINYVFIFMVGRKRK